MLAALRLSALKIVKTMELILLALSVNKNSTMEISNKIVKSRCFKLKDNVKIELKYRGIAL